MLFASIQASINNAFDVIRTPEAGGCNSSQRAKLRAAFNEVIDMVHRISQAANDMSVDRENPTVGYMVEALFDAAATEGMRWRGVEERPNEDVDVLMSIYGRVL